MASLQDLQQVCTEIAEVKEELKDVKAQIVAADPRLQLGLRQQLIAPLLSRLAELEKQKTLLRQLVAAHPAVYNDVSDLYMRKLMRPIAADTYSLQDGTGLQSALSVQLPCRLPLHPDGNPLLQSFSTLRDRFYLVPEGEPAYELATVVTTALKGPLTGITGTEMWGATSRVAIVVDRIFELSVKFLGLPITMDRNAEDATGATVATLRPDFLLWHDNALLFKGEDKREARKFQLAIQELRKKINQAWVPAAFPGAHQPCMLAYAAAGNRFQFFCIKKTGAQMQVDDISDMFDLDTVLGRAAVICSVLNISRMLAAFRHPRIPTALGQRLIKGTTEIIEYGDFVEKRVKNFSDTGPVSNLAFLTELYNSTAGCEGLIQLQGDPPHLHNDIYVVHLKPQGICPGKAPDDLPTLKAAVRGALTGLAALHSKGYVHRDVRWPNMIVFFDGSKWVLIDLEHAGVLGEVCTGPHFPLPHWGPGVLEPDYKYSTASDLVMVAQQLLSDVVDEYGVDLRIQLQMRQIVTADAALQHPWFRHDSGC